MAVLDTDEGVIVQPSCFEAHSSPLPPGTIPITIHKTYEVEAVFDETGIQSREWTPQDGWSEWFGAHK